MNGTPAAAVRGRPARVRLAAVFKAARAGAGLSQPKVAERVGHPQSWVSKVESGALLPSVADAKTLCRVYRLTGPARREVLDLVAGLREEQSRRIILARGIAGSQQRIGELEAAAAVIRSYQPCLVVGLVQTVEYARALYTQPEAGLDAEQVDAAVAARMARQGVLEDLGRRFVVVHTEGALRWQVGGPDVMAGQLDRLAQLAVDRPNMRVGVIPWTQRVDVVTNSAFQLVDDDAVMIATEVANMTPTAPADVAAYRHRFDTLERLAVFGADAVPHFERIAGEYRGL